MGFLLYTPAQPSFLYRRNALCYKINECRLIIFHYFLHLEKNWPKDWRNDFILIFKYSSWIFLINFMMEVQ